MSAPDPSSFDFASFAAWGAAIAGVVGTIAGTFGMAVYNAAKKSAVQHASGKAEESKASSPTAMAGLAEVYALLEEANSLRREATSEHRALQTALSANTDAVERFIWNLGETRDDLSGLSKDITLLRGMIDARKS